MFYENDKAISNLSGRISPRTAANIGCSRSMPVSNSAKGDQAFILPILTPTTQLRALRDAQSLSGWRPGDY